MCMFMVLGQYEEGSDDYNMVAGEFGAYYAVKNMGLWLTEADLEEMEAFCQADSLGLGVDYCMSTISMISTAGVSYCDANCVPAVDGNRLD